MVPRASCQILNYRNIFVFDPTIIFWPLKHILIRVSKTEDIFSSILQTLSISWALYKPHFFRKQKN